MYPQREFSSCGNSKQNITYKINQEEDQRKLDFLKLNAGMLKKTNVVASLIDIC